MSSSGWTSTSMPYLTPRAAGDTDAWSEEAKEAGRRGSQRIVHSGEDEAPADVALTLGLMAGAAVVVRRRIIELDGEPTELTDTYYPAAIAAGTPLAGTGKIRGGAVTLLAALGHVGVRVVESVTARMPDAEESEQLHLAAGEPVLQLARTTYDAADRPIQADVMVMPVGRQQLRYEIRIG
ncbi:GntR family transcriptional regulator [Streptomyces sp. NBC_01408]|uniref:GntR family transcriptional regulator n=1 Tax=Streptomyces sp. NBC_01408 TaxID=2903855 RepID=UPI00225B9A84|nr:UTRA domain-containing protein [Streptomyces sp. NBC_01408]MCX4693870.1 UTRA domain-containing protein [Streptomyces sp. NBC_01408]